MIRDLIDPDLEPLSEGRIVSQKEFNEMINCSLSSA